MKRHIRLCSGRICPRQKRCARQGKNPRGHFGNQGDGKASKGRNKIQSSLTIVNKYSFAVENWKIVKGIKKSTGLFIIHSNFHKYSIMQQLFQFIRRKKFMSCGFFFFIAFAQDHEKKPQISRENSWASKGSMKNQEKICKQKQGKCKNMKGKNKKIVETAGAEDSRRIRISGQGARRKNRGGKGKFSTASLGSVESFAGLSQPNGENARAKPEGKSLRHRNLQK